MMFWSLQDFLLIIANNLDFSFKFQLVLVLHNKEGKGVLPYTYIFLYAWPYRVKFALCLP